MANPHKLLFLASLFFLFSLFFLTVLSFPSLPPQIPLFPSQENPLVPKLFLILPLAAIAFFNLANFLISQKLLKAGQNIAAFALPVLALISSAAVFFAILSLIRNFPISPLFPGEEKILSLAAPLTIGAIVGLGLTIFAILLGNRLRIFDKPHGPYPQVRPIPRFGALPIYLSFALLVPIFVPWDKHLAALLLGGGILAIVQTIDDLKPLPFYIQGAGQLLGALVLVAGGIGVDFIGNPLHPFLGEPLLFLDGFKIPLGIGERTFHITLLSDLFTILWVFALTNIVDWLDGLDGLAAGIAAIAAFTLIPVSLRVGTAETVLMASLLLGILIGFLPLNFYPAKIYLGGGAFLLGFWLAALSIFSGAKTGTALLVLAVPTIDAFVVIYNRIRRGQLPFLGDTTHLHHRILEKGFSPQTIVLLEWGICALLALFALTLQGFQKLFAIGVVFILAVVLNKLVLSPPEVEAPAKEKS